MNRNDLYLSISYIDDDILEKSEGHTGTFNMAKPFKWGSLIACICLALSLGFLSVSEFFKPQVNPEPIDPVIGPDRSDFDPIDVAIDDLSYLFYDGKVYECLESAESLKRVGLPLDITGEMAGEFVSYIESVDSVEFRATDKESSVKLFQYAPSPCKAVYVLQNGNDFIACVLSNWEIPALNLESLCFSELYNVFGVCDSGDIMFISEVDWHYQEIENTEIRDRAVIEEFYNLTVENNPVGITEGDFYDIFFVGSSEDESVGLHTSFADDNRILKIKAGNGLLFYINLYPNYGYVQNGYAMAYYEMTSELAQWFASNLK